MPIPKPNKGEDKSHFMQRCMLVLKDEKKPNEQKVSICMSQWSRAEAAIIEEENSNGTKNSNS